MANILSLSAELKLCIIDQLDLTSTSFIPIPPPDLVSLSRVCTVLRTLTLPYLFKDVTLLNDEKSAVSVLPVLNSVYAEHVRTLHYIGIMKLPPDFSFAPDESGPRPSKEDLPEPAEQVLSNLAKLPNLERLTVEFRCAKTEEEDESAYRSSYDIYEELEDDEEVLESEERDAMRALMERSYTALAQNSASTVKHLDLRNVVAKKCSAWKSNSFRAVLQGLSSFTISLRGGDNGAGWQINRVQAYLSFIEELDSYFFQHLSATKHFRFAATGDGPPGLADGLNNAALPLQGYMPCLESLELEYVFISEELAAFITDHGGTLQSIKLVECYSGLGEDDAISWGDFFSSITSGNLKSLHTFEVGTSGIERMQPGEVGDYQYDDAVSGKVLREQFPERRMFDYKTMDDKYGMVFDAEETAFERFEDGNDHKSWERLCEIIRNNG